ncbi:MAG: FliG C-terminal domain-containing protein [Candidatus Brocadiia bacterium]
MADELTPAQKAAVLVMSLDDEQAAEVLKNMSESTLTKLREAAETLDVGQIGEQQKRQALRGFFVKQRGGAIFLGHPQQRFRRVLTRAMGPDGVERLYEEEQQEEEEEEEKSPREFLEELPPEQFAALLEEESPRCAALLLSNLPGEQAGRVLNLLEAEQREEIVERIVTGEAVSPEVAREVVMAFKQKLEEMGPESEAASEQKRTEELADMLGSLDKESQERILSQMHQRDPDLAEEVERLMFGWADLLKVSDRSMQELLRNVEVAQLAMALKGAAQEMCDHMFKNMSQRLRERVEEEREMSGRVPVSQVEEAREETMRLARRMYREGQLVVEIGGEQYVE